MASPVVESLRVGTETEDMLDGQIAVEESVSRLVSDAAREATLNMDDTL
jgi:hypothetical protein